MAAPGGVITSILSGGESTGFNDKADVLKVLRFVGGLPGRGDSAVKKASDETEPQKKQECPGLITPKLRKSFHLTVISSNLSRSQKLLVVSASALSNS